MRLIDMDVKSSIHHKRWIWGIFILLNLMVFINNISLFNLFIYKQLDPHNISWYRMQLVTLFNLWKSVSKCVKMS